MARGLQGHQSSGGFLSARLLQGSAANPGQAGWMGKGKDSSSERTEHVSQPLSSLRDPSSFGPPPRHTINHGAAAVPNSPTPGVGAPSHDQTYSQDVHRQQAGEVEEEAAQRPAPPPVPYRVDTTGLSTNNLPPPPVRRLDSPSSASTTSSKPRPPQPPPRLPPRTDSPSVHTTSPPPYSATAPSPSQGYVNQESTSRLSNAGVSVPSLGIGKAKDSSQSSTGTGGSAVNQLQSRFSQLRTNSGLSSGAPAPHANDGYDPAAGPSFRERHADKIDMGKQKLGGVTSRINTFVEDRKFSANANKRMPRPPGHSASPAPPAPASYAAPELSTAPDVQAQAQRKKAPPPPPPKRAEMRAAPANASPVSPSAPAPPYVPLNTKPR